MSSSQFAPERTAGGIALLVPSGFGCSRGFPLCNRAVTTLALYRVTAVQSLDIDGLEMIMDLRLQGKRALVTGSSIGMGEAIARALAAEGVAVAIHGRQPERTYAVAAEIEAQGGKTAVVLGDLTVEDEAHNVAKSATEQLGGIDILVNNAGGPGDRLFWEKTQIRAWTESYDRNVLAAVRLINHLLPPMRQSSWGRIVNVSSVAGVMPQPAGPEYGASKAAINNLSLSLTKALGASGVTVNTVSPGMIHTPKLEIQLRQIATTNGWVANGASWGEIERLFLKASQVPLGRIGRAEEVAHAVVFLCSPLASYITGADLRIDGGVVPAL